MCSRVFLACEDYIQVSIRMEKTTALPGGRDGDSPGLISQTACRRSTNSVLYLWRLAQTLFEVWGSTTDSDLAAGDAQRVWFPEMIECLRSQWHQSKSFNAIVELRDVLDAMLQQIRSQRHIQPPIFRCPRCGYVGEGVEPHVSVRAMILSLSRLYTYGQPRLGVGSGPAGRSEGDNLG